MTPVQAVNVSLQSVAPSVLRPAVDYALPYPGLLPDHPLYPLKKLRDRILLFFTRNREHKSQLLLLFADKKLAMVQVLWDKQKKDIALTMLGEGEENLVAAAALVQRLKQENILSVGVAETMERAAKKHEETIMKLLVNVSPDQQTNLQKSLSLTHQALQLIAAVKHE